MKAVRLIFLVFIIGCLSNSPTTTKTDWVSSSPYVKEFDLTKGAGPVGIYASEKIWFTEDGLRRLAYLEPNSGKIKEYYVPEHKRGISGALWDLKVVGDYVYYTHSLFSQEEDVIGVLDIKTGEVKEYRIKNASAPFLLAVNGSDVWFSELYGDKLGVLSNGKVEEIKAPGTDLGIAGLFFSNGILWVANSFPGTFSRYNGTFEEFVSPFDSSVGIWVDGKKVWLTDHASSNFGSVNVENGETEVYPTSEAKTYPNSLPNDIETDREGRIWMTEHTGNRIAAFYPKEEILIEYEIPSEGVADSLWLSIAPDNKIWFTQYSEDQLAYVDPSIDLPISLELEKYSIRAMPGEEVTIEYFLTGENASFTYSTYSKTGGGPKVRVSGNKIYIDTQDTKK